MKKLTLRLLLIISILMPFSFLKDKKDIKIDRMNYDFLTIKAEDEEIEFFEKVHQAYEKYHKFGRYKTDNYYLAVVRGIVNDKPTYGIFFFSERAEEYKIVLNNGKKNYELPTANSRKDVMIIALEELTESMEVHIYKDNNKVSLDKRIILSPYNKEDLLAISSLLNGENLGADITALKVSKNMHLMYLIIGIASVTIGCGIIILVFATSKKGMFDKQRRKEGVFDFKEFLKTQINEEKVNEFEIIELEKEEEVDHEETEREIYNKVVKYDDEEKSNFSISDYLKDKGLITDYQKASQEEKQKIMLELMLLRDENKITNDEYLEEAYKLWKE